MRSAPTRVIAAAFILFAAALSAQCSSTPEGLPPFKPVATVAAVMAAIVIPSSQAIFDSVVYDNGQLIAAPESDDDWFRLRTHAMGVAEAGNLMMMAPRAKDTADWMTMSAALNDSAMVVVKATEAKDIDALLKAGGEMYNACTACHAKYIMAVE